MKRSQGRILSSCLSGKGGNEVPEMADCQGTSGL